MNCKQLCEILERIDDDVEVLVEGHRLENIEVRVLGIEMKATIREDEEDTSSVRLDSVSRVVVNLVTDPVPDQIRRISVNSDDVINAISRQSVPTPSPVQRRPDPSYLANHPLERDEP